MIRTSTIKALIVSLLLIAPAANAVILDFEDFTGTNFEHGTVVFDQYNIADFGFATITADNAGTGPDLAVAFDSGLSGTRDPDLEAGMSGFTHVLDGQPGDLGSIKPGNILIIQENFDDCVTGVCSKPDDQANGGSLTIRFEKPVILESLDFFDIEVGENSNKPGSEINFLDELGAILPIANEFTPNTNGDNKWDRLFFAGITGVYGIEVNLIGSGAIDNLVYSVVPVPAAIWLFGTALLGFIGISRRKPV